jgi:hypothetical protein
MAALAAICLVIGLLAPLALDIVLPAVRVVARADVMMIGVPNPDTILSLSAISWSAAVLLLLGMALLLIRGLLPRGKERTTTGTWDCGYARPTARMQYTASSFAQPLTDLFRPVLRTKIRGRLVRGFFPVKAAFKTETPDVARERLFAPLFRAIDLCAAPIRRMQSGRVHEYLFYIAVVLVLLLIWKAGGRP